MAENIYFPLNGGSGGSEAAPHITITVDELKYDYSGTLTAEQIATLKKDDSYIEFNIVTSGTNMKLILNKTQTVPNEGPLTHLVFSTTGYLDDNMIFSLIVILEQSMYQSIIFDPAFYLTGVKVNGTELDSPNNIAELNLKTINSQSIVGTGDITVEGGAEVIERGINLSTSKFTTALTADEFNKLKNNEAVIKITTTYYDIIPLVLYGSNPSIINGTAIGSDYDMLVYAIPSPLTDNPAVYIVVIQSDTLDSFSLSTVQAYEPITSNSNTSSYSGISDTPLLGFALNEADAQQLHVSRSLYVGKFTYASSTSEYSFSYDSTNQHFVMSLGNLLDSNGPQNLSSFEAVLEIPDNVELNTHKYYSCILHISNSTSDSSEGTFIIYDTSTNKVTYVVLRIYAFSSVGGSGDTPFIVNYLKAYQDGTEITSTFVSKISGIYLYLL